MYIPNSAGKRRATAVFLLPSLLGVVVFCLLPILASAVFSVMDYDLLMPLYSKLLRKINTSVTVEDYGKLEAIDISGED